MCAVLQCSSSKGAPMLRVGGARARANPLGPRTPAVDLGAPDAALAMRPDATAVLAWQTDRDAGVLFDPDARPAIPGAHRHRAWRGPGPQRPREAARRQGRPVRDGGRGAAVTGGC